MSILKNISNIQCVTLQENDVLVVSVNCDNLSPATAQKYMSDVKDVISLYFLSNRILVIPNDIKLSVVAQSEKGVHNEIN